MTECNRRSSPKLELKRRCARKKTRDLVTRHNRVRNLVFSLADVGLLSPEMEKIGLWDPRTRPGDVSFKTWSFNRGLAIDVAVICPVAESNLSCDEPCEVYARKRKHKLYDPGFIKVAMVFETSGALNSEGRCSSKLFGLPLEDQGWAQRLFSSSLGEDLLLHSVIGSSDGFEQGLL